jgi:23S rRNA (cytosine1962-C5)-methyltransferase
MMSTHQSRIPPVTVSPKAEASLLRGHPWIFSGAMQKQDPSLANGTTVAVYAADGRWLAWAACSPHSQIRLRVWSCDNKADIDADFFKNRLNTAIQARRRMPLLTPCTAVRLVNAESDGLPGLIVDRYADYLVCQFLSAGAAYWKEVVVAHLRDLMPVKGIFERSDAQVRIKEGLPLHSGLLWGQAPPEKLTVELGRLKLLVDIAQGHKTGLYLDQRENQAQAADFAAGADVLNCFSYTGGFGLWALQAGARHVCHIDSSADMLALARQNARINGLDTADADYIQGNAFELLRRYRDSRRSFDLIVLDPPKFVAAAGQLNKGCRGYKDINLLAFKLLRPGGILMTFSCSGLVDAALFQKIVAAAALDAGRTVRLIRYLHQAADHPIGLNFPEGYYLKGMICMAE